MMYSELLLEYLHTVSTQQILTIIIINLIVQMIKLKFREFK